MNHDPRTGVGASAPARARGTERGFSLVELMVTIVIFSILMAIVLPNYLSARSRSCEAVMRSDLHNVMMMIEDYQLQVGELPDQEAVFEATTGFRLSPHVSYEEFAREMSGVALSVHVDLKHQKALRTMHIHYPGESNAITFH